MGSALKVLGVAIVLLIAAYFVYGSRAEARAEARARAFCAGIEVGAIYADVVAQADDVGEPRWRISRDSEISVGFTGLPPFSRHLCRVTRDGERVGAADYIHLD